MSIPFFPLFLLLSGMIICVIAWLKYWKKDLKMQQVSEPICSCKPKTSDGINYYVADVFETLSERVKKENSQNNTNLLQVYLNLLYCFWFDFCCIFQDQEGPSQRLDVANEQKPLFEVINFLSSHIKAMQPISVTMPSKCSGGKFYNVQ